MRRIVLPTVAAFSVILSASAFATGLSQNYPTPAPEVTKPEKKGAAAKEAMLKAAKAAPSGGSAVVVYVPCFLMSQWTAGAIGPTGIVSIDGKEAGEVHGCGSRRFAVAAGQREISIREKYSLFNFGLPGPKYEVAPGKPTYIRAFYYKGFDQRQVPAEQGKAEIDSMPKPK